MFVDNRKVKAKPKVLNIFEFITNPNVPEIYGCYKAAFHFFGSVCIFFFFFFVKRKGNRTRICRMSIFVN